MRPTLTALLLVALPGLGSAPLAQTTTFTEPFTGASNTGAWTWGVPGPTIEVAGGNPGAFLREDFLDACCPLLHTSVAGSVFTGSYRANGVTSVGVDLNVLDVDFSSDGRPLTLELINNNGTTGTSFDDFGAWFVGPDLVPSAGTGWFAYDFAVDAASTTLPAGWVLFRFDGGTPTHTWSDVVTDVDRLAYFYGDPEFFFIFQAWEMGLDNARITLADCDSNGVADVLDIQAGTYLDLDGDGRPDVCQELSANTGSLSLASGGAQTYALHAGPASGLDLYWVLGSVSGTSPGLPLAGGGELPLVVDNYFVFTLLNPNTLITSSLAFLDGNGAASAAWAIPPGLSPTLAGVIFYHAYVTLDPLTLEAGLASNFVRLRLLP